MLTSLPYAISFSCVTSLPAISLCSFISDSAAHLCVSSGKRVAVFKIVFPSYLLCSAKLESSGSISGFLCAFLGLQLCLWHFCVFLACVIHRRCCGLLLFFGVCPLGVFLWHTESSLASAALLCCALAFLLFSTQSAAQPKHHWESCAIISLCLLAMDAQQSICVLLAVDPPRSGCGAPTRS